MPPEFVPVTVWTGVSFPVGRFTIVRWETLMDRLCANRGYSGDETHGGWSPAQVLPCHADPPCRVCANERPHRRDENVRTLFAVVLDYDKGTPIEDAVRIWEMHEGVLHTTRKHTREQPRFRVVLRLSRFVTPEEHARIWTACAKRAEAAGHVLDVVTRNPSRFWYTPGSNGIFHAELLPGRPIAVDETLKLVPSARPALEVVHVRTNRGCVRLDKRHVRAAAYLAEMPASVSGQGGHQALWAAALALVRGFALSEDAALELLRRDFNPRCQPPWSDRELQHKVRQAANNAKTAPGYLLNAS